MTEAERAQNRADVARWLKTSAFAFGAGVVSGGLALLFTGATWKFAVGSAAFMGGIALLSYFPAVFMPAIRGERAYWWQRGLFSLWVLAQYLSVGLLALAILIEGLPYIVRQYPSLFWALLLCVPGLLFWKKNRVWMDSGRWPKDRQPYGDEP